MGGCKDVLFECGEAGYLLWMKLGEEPAMCHSAPASATHWQGHSNMPSGCMPLSGSPAGRAWQKATPAGPAGCTPCVGGWVELVRAWVNG